MFPSVALFTDSNNIMDNAFCIIAKNAPPYNKSGNVTLEYETCQFSNPVDAHKNAINKYLKKPTGMIYLNFNFLTCNKKERRVKRINIDLVFL